jgi:hypothetical protein
MNKKLLYEALHVCTLYHLYLSPVCNRKTVVCNVNHVQIDAQKITQCSAVFHKCHKIATGTGPVFYHALQIVFK